MYHPLTKEKKYLTRLADKIRDCKVMLSDVWYETGYITAQTPCSNSNTFDMQEMANKQRELSRLKRAYRNRHIAYCLVRRGINKDSKDSKGRIEAIQTASKPNMNMVNAHRMRLLTEIAQVYSDECDRLLKQIPKEPAPPSFITESDTISKKVWDTISAPICLVENDDGTAKELAICDFKQNAAGDFLYEVTQPGVVHVQQGYPRRVNTDDTLNFQRNEVTIELPIAEFPIPDLKEIYAINQRDDDFKKVIEKITHYLMIAEDFRWTKSLTMKHIWDYLPTGDHMQKGTDLIYEIHGERFHESVDIEYVRDYLNSRLSTATEIPMPTATANFRTTPDEPKTITNFNECLPDIGEAWQQWLEQEDECPNFVGLIGDWVETGDECSLGGLCTENFPNCRYYQEAQTWNRV